MDQEVKEKSMGQTTVIWNVEGQFYQLDNGQYYDAGFFTYIQGIPDKFLSLVPQIAFVAEPFNASTNTNGNLTILSFPAGQFSVFKVPPLPPSFEKPESWLGLDNPIATYQRNSTSFAALTSSSGFTTLTFDLIDSRDFTLDGNIYSWNELMGKSVTQNGFSAPYPSTQTRDGTTTISSFVGTAFN